VDAGIKSEEAANESQPLRELVGFLV
jgi:hypothetical protein